MDRIFCLVVISFEWEILALEILRKLRRFLATFEMTRFLSSRSEGAYRVFQQVLSWRWAKRKIDFTESSYEDKKI
uniref:Uncharacterized protein n=1 Tax=Candidatus Kentrum sp. FW TaxID=2126338 RepID=A0A450SVT5_9GAMM|nr:MAG: hypothetical protein BECKFW1821A_GA0114235_10788 [Candidatus Kentron sp. FW]